MHRWLLTLLRTAAFGQTSDVPHSEGIGPLFTNVQALGPYPDLFPSIRSIDFQNLRFLNFNKAGKPSGGKALKNGHFQHDEKLQHYSIDLDSVHYLPGSTGEFALALYSYFETAVSSSSKGIARGFTSSGNRLRVVQEITWDTHFQVGQPTNSLDSSTNTLVIRSAHYIPGDAHCCFLLWMWLASNRTEPVSSKRASKLSCRNTARAK